MSRENVEIVLRTYDAFGRRDIVAALDVFAERLEWIQPASLPWGGVYVTPEEVGRFFETLGEYVEDGRVEPDATLDAGDHVVVLGRFSGTARLTGETFVVRLAHVWRLRGGKVDWFSNYVDTAALRDVIAPHRE